jgi:hypothetical protein
MATTYTSTIDVNVWKEHECARCGTVFRYLFKRKKTGQGNSPDAASKAAHAAVVKALEHEVDMQPCPGCGLYQPDMVAARRSRGHWWTFWAGVPVFALLLILVLADVIVLSMAAVLAAVAAGVLLLAHLSIDFNNSNANLGANHDLARRREQAGQLWVPSENKRGQEETQVGSGVTGAHGILYLLLAAGVLAFLAPEVVRLAGGMKSNPGWFPQVIGPGEEAYIYFPSSISSIKGMWNGTPRVTVLNADEVGLAPPPVLEPKRLPAPPPPPLSARAKADNWGGTIRFKSSERSSSSRLWSYVRLPDNPSLAGKTLKLRIDMDVRFPVYRDANRGEVRQEQHRHTAMLTVSPGKAAGTYVRAWWFGFLAGISLTLLCGAFLAVTSGAFRKKALATRIFVPERPESMEAGEGEEREDRPRRPPDDNERNEGRFRPEDDRGPDRDDDRFRR